jgi:hypothetical protein
MSGCRPDGVEPFQAALHNLKSGESLYSDAWFAGSGVAEIER